MSTRLRWQVGSDSPDLTGVESVAALKPSKRRRSTRFALTRGFVAAYAIALFAAAGGGFGLGRWSEARGAVTHGINGEVEVETLAWNERDLSLYEAGLDPDAPATWRAERLAAFEREAPMPWSAQVVDITLEGAVALVELEIETRSDGVDAPGTEMRRYRSIGGTWVWREP